MKKTLLLSLVALFAAPGATAAPQHHELTVRGEICGKTTEFRAPVTDRAARVDAYVGKFRMLGVKMNTGDTVYMVGNSAVVQATQNNKGVTVRAVRTVPVCAQLRVVFMWSTSRDDTPATAVFGHA